MCRWQIIQIALIGFVFSLPVCLLAQLSKIEHQPIYLTSTSSLFELSGAVTHKNFPVDSVVVYLYREQVQGTVELVDSSESYGKNGKYSFDRMARGTYYLKARNKGSGNKVVDTYFGNSPVWIKSKAVILRQNMTGKNINLLSQGNSKGLAKISGNVKFGATENVFTPGSAAQNIPVVLLHNEELITQTYTTHNGDFFFSDIPIMSYNVVVDFPGKSTGGDVASLNSSNYYLSGMEFLIEKSTVELKEKTSLKTAVSEERRIRVFPNPVQHKLFVEGAYAEHYKVIDLTGALMVRGDFIEENFIDFSSFERGFYLLIVEGKGGQEVIRITKQ